ncbi:hypothetical protein BD311DRAFT_707685 [Dichomitus squalens]|uniref:GPI anchored protein n=1 Tax=Dichomitus squalens TaxID=114155 RepID=A0A4Q9N4M5_9APHY|nr:hypothetical protein BD311DRAFT_707685 [Dichomitus squalens]
MRTSASAGALVLCASFAAAQTTLYIPGFDPQAITADEVGTDASGHTTWVIGPGVTSGTYEDAPGIIGSATLVAGASDAHLVWNDPVDSLFLSEDCAINGGIAVCTAVASVEGVISTAIETETATGFVVQGNSAAPTAAAPGGSSGSNTAAATGSTPSAGSAATSGPSKTGSAGASQTSVSASGNGNGAGRMEMSTGLSLGVVGLISALFL